MWQLVLGKNGWSNDGPMVMRCMYIVYSCSFVMYRCVCVFFFRGLGSMRMLKMLTHCLASHKDGISE